MWNPYHGFVEAGRPLVVLGNLTLSKREVRLGERVTVTLDATNLGGAPATLNLELRVDGKPTASRLIRLEPGSSLAVEFAIDTSDLEEGLHVIEVGGLEAPFRVVRGRWSLEATLAWLAAIAAALLALACALKKARRRRGPAEGTCQ